MNPAYSALLLCLVACGDDLGGPGGPLLLGDWGTGGDNPAHLIGLRVGVELQLLCNSVGVSRPVSLDPDGHFAFRGRWQLSTLTSDKPTAVVDGHVAGDAVHLRLDVLGDGLPPQAITLQKGVDPNFEALPPVCPL